MQLQRTTIRRLAVQPRLPTARRMVSHMTQLPKHQRIPRDSLGRATSTYRNPGPKPSDDFDWDHQFTLNAITFRDLGYTLTTQQKARIRNHEKH